MNELELCCGCVSSFDLLDCIEHLRIITEEAGDRAQSANVLRVIPPCVVATAIRVGNEGDGHVACLLSNRLAPALNEKKYRAVANAGCTEAHVLIEYLEPVKTHDIFVGVHADWIKCVEGGPFHCNHGLRRRCIDAHRIPKLGDLHANVQCGFITGCELYELAVGAKASYEGSFGHDALAAASRGMAGPTRESAGGSVLRNLAIC